ncbi:MAG: heavy metal-associated domain-containing protein [Pirellulaceae bacterium]|nr:heavy-metal-associated domain-containing protein [Planctomycetales bacterium]MCA9207254.1 heavy-metal-associated domain-containing protein [Planctomycetales bacterium]MCA9218841.1 heavy-metal-associated domain-containing protein [Planctomycetales bacterium]
MNQPVRLLVSAMLLTGWLVSTANAASPVKNASAIVVKDMHCATCAQKIAAKLYAVPAVLEVRADVKSNTAYIVPQSNKQVSPRALWEAVEAAGFEPVALNGPSGSFKSKPTK